MFRSRSSSQRHPRWQGQDGERLLREKEENRAMGSVEISCSCSWSPIPAASTTASENHERMVRERREENKAMGSVEISYSQSPIPAASTMVSGDGERLVREWREENGRRWGARECVSSRSRRRRREVKMVEAWCRRGGANRREENDKRWGLGNGFRPDLGGDDSKAEMVKDWCGRGGRTTRDGGLENGFCPNLGGDDGKRRWWKAGAGEVVRERREENDRRWGARNEFHPDLGGDDSDVEMVKGWCGRGGRRTTGYRGLKNWFHPDLKGNDGKRIWWKAGAEEVLWERREENGRRWGLGNGIWEATKAKMGPFTNVRKEN